MRPVALRIVRAPLAKRARSRRALRSPATSSSSSSATHARIAPASRARGARVVVVVAVGGARARTPSRARPRASARSRAGAPRGGRRGRVLEAAARGDRAERAAVLFERGEQLGDRGRVAAPRRREDERRARRGREHALAAHAARQRGEAAAPRLARGVVGRAARGGGCGEQHAVHVEEHDDAAGGREVGLVGRRERRGRRGLRASLRHMATVSDPDLYEKPLERRFVHDDNAARATADQYSRALRRAFDARRHEPPRARARRAPRLARDDGAAARARPPRSRPSACTQSCPRAWPRASSRSRARPRACGGTTRRCPRGSRGGGGASRRCSGTSPPLGARYIGTPGRAPAEAEAAAARARARGGAPATVLELRFDRTRARRGRGRAAQRGGAHRRVRRRGTARPCAREPQSCAAAGVDAPGLSCTLVEFDQPFVKKSLVTASRVATPPGAAAAASAAELRVRIVRMHPGRYQIRALSQRAREFAPITTDSERLLSLAPDGADGGAPPAAASGSRRCSSARRASSTSSPTDELYPEAGRPARPRVHFGLSLVLTRLPPEDGAGG